MEPYELWHAYITIANTVPTHMHNPIPPSFDKKVRGDEYGDYNT